VNEIFGENGLDDPYYTLLNP